MFTHKLAYQCLHRFYPLSPKTERNQDGHLDKQTDVPYDGTSFSDSKVSTIKLWKGMNKSQMFISHWKKSENMTVFFNFILLSRKHKTTETNTLVVAGG